jgi:hypothetical protein
MRLAFAKSHPLEDGISVYRRVTDHSQCRIGHLSSQGLKVQNDGHDGLSLGEVMEIATYIKDAEVNGWNEQARY